MLMIRGAYIWGGLYSGGAYIRDFTVCYLSILKRKKTLSGGVLDFNPQIKIVRYATNGNILK